MSTRYITLIVVALGAAASGPARGADATEPELACWQLMPGAAGNPDALAREADRLAAARPDSRWLGVYRLYLASLRQDRAAMIAGAEVKGPEQFPYVADEARRLESWIDAGMTPAQAGLKLLAGRSYEPLHALLDLDRALMREAEFLRRSEKPAEAARLEAARDRLREAYLACSRHVVERCFALSLLGQEAQSKSLAEKAARIGWLNNPEALREALGAMDSATAWKEVIQPLVQSEVAVVENPPALPDAPGGVRPVIVEATKVVAGEGAKVYTGEVRISAGDLRINCERAAVIARGDAAMVSGSGKVQVRGIGGAARTTGADAFTWSSDTGELSLSGRVHIDGRRARLAVIDRGGQVAFQRTLLEDLKQASSPADKLRIAAGILAEYPDAEMSDEARLWAAMGLIRRQLTWHAPYPPPPRGEKEHVTEQLRDSDDDPRWQEAHAGEPWMREDARRQLGPAAFVGGGAPFWRLRDPGHADVARAVALLSAVAEPKLRHDARHWAQELGRNNTVITFDITGGYAAGAAAPVVMDIRAAESVSFKLYRVTKAADLLAIADRIGDDFIYRDYGLQHAGRAEQAKRLKAMQQLSRRLGDMMAPLDLPRLDDADRVAAWDAEVAKLKAVSISAWAHRHWGWDEDDDDDDWYFDDRCERFRARLEKAYLRDGISSWQGDRVVEIPADALKAPGAYVLVGTANGQSAYAPILVEPLSLTMRRCRDGVFVLVSDNTGKQPAAGAAIHAKGMMGRCVADEQGAGFARVFAAGDRPIIAEKDGRFAIGGFGKVFEGIYRSSDEDHWKRWDRMLRQRTLRQAADAAAQVYADGFVAAAYTDRPTYRPGQEVNFKLIVRRLKELPSGSGFRDEDFEPGANLALPALGSPLRYEVINPRGRAIAGGELNLNDFGTAAGKIALSPEEPTGAYALRVWLGGTDRLVPDVFAVKYYRRPNFEVKLSGAPTRLEGARELELRVEADYYFGKPVAGGKLDVRIVRPSQWKPVASQTATLDASGKAAIRLALPESLEAGEHFIIASVTDESGRTVSRSIATEAPASELAARGRTFAALPRFAAIDEVLSIKAAAPVEVVNEHRKLNPVNGVVELRLSTPGWHTLACAGETAEIFIYGPGAAIQRLQKQSAADTEPGGWVRLDDADREDRGGWHADDGLMVLFDKQHVKVGQNLRVLVRLPRGGARMVFTMEGRTVMDYFLASAKGPFAVIEIPIRQRHAPNFYLQGRAIAFDGDWGAQAEAVQEKLKEQLQEKEEGSDPRWCRVDVLSPPEPPGGQKLKIDVATDRSSYQPGEEVRVAVKVTDLAGKPCEAEFSLAGVDESVYALGEDALENLPRMLASRRGPTRYYEKTWRTSIGRRSYDLKALQMMQKAMQMAQAMETMQAMDQLRKMEDVARSAEPAMPPAQRIPGQRPVTSIELAALRTDFRETATWQPQLRTGPDGRASARFRLPDSLTSYRLSAVGLTRDTKIGVGRAGLRATRPIAVQVFLPRFAVEGDQLTAVALVHNNTAARQRCEVAWTVAGARARAGLRQEIDVPANGSARAQLPLAMERAGDVSVDVRAGNGEHADGERRQLRIEPLGRAREVAINGAIDKSARLRLPAGFVASELTITLTRRDPAAAMEGLGYLIDYPYGCVEQTMSRFRPAVAISHAAGQLKLDLPAEARGKLPEVLARGLARLYNFQHADGGWGWWEKDATSVPMTLYVLEGLARCRSTGTAVDAQVLARACEHVKAMLAQRNPDPDIAARAWLVLALAGHADPQQLAEYSNGVMKSASAQARCALALACRLAGRIELARRLWSGCSGWNPESTAGLALKLEAQVAFVAPLNECYATAYALLDRRQGDRWENTEATAAAIESLASMLRFSTGTIHARKVRVQVGDAVAMDESDPKQLEKLSYRVRLSGAQLPARDQLPIELSIDCDQPVQYAITATGAQRLDKFEESGDAIRLRRELRTLDDRPISGPLKVGEVIAVKLSLELAAPREYVIVEDRRPAGCEFADEQLAGGAPSHVEFRDDRLCAFFTRLSAGRHEMTYYLRAETAGTSHMLPGCAYPMYQEKIRGDTAANVMDVRK